MGLLSLANLIYYAQHYKEAIRGILIHDDLHYPWAVAGIQVTCFLAQKLDLSRGELIAFD